MPTRLVSVVYTPTILAAAMKEPACEPPFLEMIADRGVKGIKGPVFDIKGRIVAHGSLLYAPPRDMPLYTNFGYPADYLFEVAEGMRLNGRVRRAALGVTFMKVTLELAELSGLHDTNGALVADVTPNSEAYKAGIQKADIIVAVNGRRLKRYCEYYNFIRAGSPGESMKLTVRRHKSDIDIPVTLEERPFRKNMQ